MKKFWQKLTNWELWPFNLIYAPLGPVWLWYAIKARTFWFFTPTNPSLLFGGFEVGSKKEMYAQLPSWSYPKTLFIRPGKPMEEIRSEILSKNIKYPIVVKPDIGMQGVLFRVIQNESELANYHQRVPVEYIIQDYIDLPMEFSVFYIRYPGTKKGTETGFILKDYMHVTGDGKKTLQSLIDEHPKAKHRKSEMKHKHGNHWTDIIQAGEKYYLSVAGNHNRGARFINLHREIDQRLCDIFDRISNDAGQFYYGRYDLKCTSVEELKEGKNLFILEFNGAGAEPNHIYDCKMKYGKALKVLSNHWYHMYKIGWINHKNGIPYWGYWKGRRLLQKSRRDFKILEKIDRSFN